MLGGCWIFCLKIFNSLQLAKIRDWENAHIQHTQLSLLKPAAAEQADDLHSLCPKSIENRDSPEHVVMKGSFFRNSKLVWFSKQLQRPFIKLCDDFSASDKWEVKEWKLTELLRALCSDLVVFVNSVLSLCIPGSLCSSTAGGRGTGRLQALPQPYQTSNNQHTLS